MSKGMCVVGIINSIRGILFVGVPNQGPKFLMSVDKRSYYSNCMPESSLAT